MDFNNPNPCEALIDAVIDNYRLLNVVGQGGMGCVYKARDEKMGRIVALKVLRNNLGVFSSREGKALGQLNHPNIVNVFYMGESKEGNFIAMEFVDGGTLHEYIGHAAMDIIPIMKQSLLALEHAHEKGVIHRDIKPSNIMVSKTNQVKMMDFGLAKVESRDKDRTITRLQAGTISYMSPEQVRGLQHVSQLSDIYSLGKTFYHILAGRLPFNAGESDQYSILKAIIERQFKPPSHYNTDVPKGLDRIVMKAIEKDASNRYQSAREMYQAMVAFEEKLKAKSTARTRTSKPSIPVPIALGRNKVTLGIAGAIMVLLITAATAWYTNRDLPQDQQERPQTITTNIGEEAPVTRAERNIVPPDTTGTNKDVDIEHAFISINATPSNSIIQIDEEQFDSNQKHQLIAGEYRIVVSSDGFDSYTNTIQLNAEADTTLSIELLPQGRLIVDSNIPGGRVLINQDYQGNTPFNETMPQGTYAVAVSAEGYPDYRQRVRVRSGNDIRVSATFQPLSTLKIVAIPDGDLFIDGEKQSISGESEWFETQIPQGTHTIRITHDDYGFWEKEVDISESEENLIVDFTQQIQADVWSSEVGAAIYVDGVKVEGKETWARISLNVGMRRIEIKKDGYTADPPFIEQLIEGNETNPIRFSFQLSKSDQ